MKILVVDDSKMARRSVISKIPKDLNYELAEAADGVQAVSEYKKIKPDIVFLDLTMPEKDGYDALKEIIEFDSDAYVIVVSADVQPKAIERVLALGAKKHISKNMQESEITEIINSYLSGKK